MKKKLLIFIVAYNHEKTIENVIKRIPKKLLGFYNSEILIIDDASVDKTFEISKKIKEKFKNASFKVNIFYNPINQGYGGNQKIGYHYAIKKNFDSIILDDGFQDTEIKKNINIVCFNSKQKMGNGYTIPAAPLRQNL